MWIPIRLKIIINEVRNTFLKQRLLVIKRKALFANPFRLIRLLLWHRSRIENQHWQLSKNVKYVSGNLERVESLQYGSLEEEIW